MANDLEQPTQTSGDMPSDTGPTSAEPRTGEDQELSNVLGEPEDAFEALGTNAPRKVNALLGQKTTSKGRVD